MVLPVCSPVVRQVNTSFVLLRCWLEGVWVDSKEAAELSRLLAPL